MITIEELDERKQQIAERLVKKFTESGLGLMYQYPDMTSIVLTRKQMSIARAGWYAKQYAVNCHSRCQNRI